MIFGSGLGIVLSLVFGCLLLALIAELYYLLWWKKLRITSTASIEDGKELFYLFCWNKPPISIPPTTSISGRRESTPSNPETLDIELGSSKEFLLRTIGTEQDALVEAELMRIHNRFLFTIKEETKEDLESEGGRSRNRSLSELFISPIPSPSLTEFNNPLFESSSVLEAEMNKLRSSPPPSFKFLRDAEEKLYRRLIEEAEKMRKSGGGFEEDEGKEGSLIKRSCSQVLPLKPILLDQISPV